MFEVVGIALALLLLAVAIRVAKPAREPLPGVGRSRHLPPPTSRDRGPDDPESPR